MRNTLLMSAAVAGALSLFAVVTSASAATVTLTASSPQGGGNTADVYGSGYGAAGWAVPLFDENPTVAVPPANVSGIYQSPFNNTPQENFLSYFSVGGVDGDGDGSSSPNTLTFTSQKTSFDILWGSIDSYNTITFLNGSTVVDSYTGSDIISMFGLPDNGSANYEEVALLNFSNLAYTSVRFQSTSAAFEFGLNTDAPPVSSVPLPATLPLFATGLGALGFAGWRKRKKAKAA
jgi:hypothetical protein